MFWKIWKMRRPRNFFRIWSGRWESNPRPKLGKLLYCHCTTPAHLQTSKSHSHPQARAGSASSDSEQIIPTEYASASDSRLLFSPTWDGFVVCGPPLVSRQMLREAVLRAAGVSSPAVTTFSSGVPVISRAPRLKVKYWKPHSTNTNTLL
jgi:hypothetical protein